MDIVLQFGHKVQFTTTGSLLQFSPHLREWKYFPMYIFKGSGRDSENILGASLRF